MNDSTAIAIPEPRDLVAMFRAKDGLDPIIARIEAEVKSHVPDVTTKKGRDAIASLAYKVSRSKTALDEAGKSLNEDARAQINAVDAERRKVRDKLDALKDLARKPLDEWEALEKERIDRIKARLDRMANAAPAEDTPTLYQALIDRVEAVAIDDTWQEFVTDAAKAKDASLVRLRLAMATAIDRDRIEAENERLRLEIEAMADAERERKALADAQAAAVAEAELAAKIEREKIEAAERARVDAEAKAKAEAEQAAADAAAMIEAERKAASDREAALLLEIEASAQRERARIAAEKVAEDAARAKREADVAHRQNIKASIADALRAMSGNATPESIADALMAGKIPHCEVKL